MPGFFGKASAWLVEVLEVLEVPEVLEVLETKIAGFPHPIHLHDTVHIIAVKSDLLTIARA